MKYLQVLTCFVVISIGHLRGEVLKFAADPWMPISGDPTQGQTGYFVDILKAVFEAKGYTVDYQAMPWTRAIEEARQGRITGIIGAFKSDAPDFIFPKTPQGIIENTFFALKNNPWKYEGIASLQKVRLGTTLGYAYGEPLDSYLSQNKENPLLVQPLSGDDPLGRNIMKLQKKRIDVVIEAKMVWEYTAAQKKMEADFKEAGHLGREETFVAFSPKISQSKKYASILDEGMQTLRKSGELQKILDRYNLKNNISP